MRTCISRRRLLLACAVHLWWLVLCGPYMLDFWRGPEIAGADGAGHVAALKLYAEHAYPSLQGWLPEFFGGMPFPVFYPPLFYWLGATVMKVSGADATLTAKLLTTASFAALPGALLYLGRRLGLSPAEATAAAAAAGVIACGQNVAAQSGVGLRGLFEVGLYTQTLGFVWFCLWCGALAHAKRSRAAALVAVLSLAATVLTNVHLLPLVAAFGLCRLALDLWLARYAMREGRLRAAFTSAVRTVSLGAASLLLTGVWLLPLVGFYPYSTGQPLPPKDLLSQIGSLNVVWLACAWCAWRERRRRPALAALCIALLLCALASLTPLGSLLPEIPLQPWRVASSAVVLGTIPLAVLLVKSLREVTGGNRALLWAGMAAGLFGLMLIHPRQAFVAASLGQEQAEALGRVREAMRAMPPGRALVEIFEISKSPTASFHSAREVAESRSLTHWLAADGRETLWAVFREHSVFAPMATSVRNLFSSAGEEFGMDGVGLRMGTPSRVSVEESVRLARHLGVAYYLVKSPAQVSRLRDSGSLRPVWEINGWHLFTAREQPSPQVEAAAGLPVVAWLPAKFKSRLPSDFDLFNLSELLFYEGHPEVCVLWALSEGSDVVGALTSLPAAIVVVDPSVAPRQTDTWLSGLVRAGDRLRVIVLDDGSPAVQLLHERRGRFAHYERLDPGDTPTTRVASLREASRLITLWQTERVAQTAPPEQLWRWSTPYFPSWRTAEGRAVWLTGQGMLATIEAAPSARLRRHPPATGSAALATSCAGVVVTLLLFFKFGPAHSAALKN